MQTLRITAAFYERFMTHVEKRGDGCWIWTGTVARSGYGALTSRPLFGKQTQLAHRVSYRMWKNAAIPAGYNLDHLCRNPKCVNPQHLQAVPFAVNTRRGKVAKLSAVDVLNIRTEYIPGVTKQADIAKKYGVHPAHISRIANSRFWGTIHARFERT